MSRFWIAGGHTPPLRFKPARRSARDKICDRRTFGPQAARRPQPAQIVEARNPIGPTGFNESAHRAKKFTLSEGDIGRRGRPAFVPKSQQSSSRPWRDAISGPELISESIHKVCEVLKTERIGGSPCDERPSGLIRLPNA